MWHAAVKRDALALPGQGPPEAKKQQVEAKTLPPTKSNAERQDRTPAEGSKLTVPKGAA